MESSSVLTTRGWKTFDQLRVGDDLISSLTLTPVRLEYIKRGAIIPHCKTLFSDGRVITLPCNKIHHGDYPMIKPIELGSYDSYDYYDDLLADELAYDVIVERKRLTDLRPHFTQFEQGNPIRATTFIVTFLFHLFGHCPEVYNRCCDYWEIPVAVDDILFIQQCIWAIGGLSRLVLSRFDNIIRIRNHTNYDSEIFPYLNSNGTTTVSGSIVAHDRPEYMDSYEWYVEDGHYVIGDNFLPIADSTVSVLN